MSNLRRLGLAVAFATLGAPAALAQNYLFNVDVPQCFSASQDNFEYCVKGNWTNPVLTVYPTSPGWVLSGVSYDASRNETCFAFVGPGLAKRNAPYHFGLTLGGYTGGHLPSTRQFWTRGPIGSPTATASVGSVYNAATRSLTVTVSNDTDQPQQVSNVGHRLFDAEQPLEAMDRQGMPPSSMIPSGLPTAVLQPGQSLQYHIQNVSAGQFLVSRLDVRPVTTGPCGPVSAWIQTPVQAVVAAQ